MRAIGTIFLGTVGIFASMKPSSDSFRTSSGNFQTRLINSGMKKANVDSNTFSGAIVGAIGSDVAAKQFDMKVATYDFVVCKVGVMSLNMPNEQKKWERKNIYWWGVLNKWTDGNQTVMRTLVEGNDKMFGNSMDKIQL